MGTEQKFLAAVNVINSLPSDGPFQPSRELTLKFKAYYKQATDGPCNVPKPSFFDRSKHEWQAWKELGDMPKEIAMEKYVEQLSKVIETMSYTDAVSKFIDLMGPFYEIVWPDDVSGESGDDSRHQEMTGIRSHEQRMEISANETVPTRVNTDNIQESFEFVSHQSVTTESVSLERFEVSYHKETTIPIEHVSRESHSLAVGAASLPPPETIPIAYPDCAISANEVLPMLLNLQQSLEDVLRRLGKLEVMARIQDNNTGKVERKSIDSKKRTPTLLTMLLVVFWPFIVHWVVYSVRRKTKIAR